MPPGATVTLSNPAPDVVKDHVRSPGALQRRRIVLNRFTTKEIRSAASRRISGKEALPAEKTSNPDPFRT
jgi:hypothetical protein